MVLIIPGDPAAPHAPDELFASEAEAAREAGFEVAYVDHDALGRVGHERDAVRRVPPGRAIYRGWMLSSARYEAYAAALASRGVALRTTAEAYRRAHELPGWYAAFESSTPTSVWTSEPSLEQLNDCAARLGSGPAVLRDFVKSAKHDWSEACFIPDVGDRVTLERIARRFRELRGDDFAGGFVLRRFENFQGAEARTWWVDGQCRLVTAHPDTPDAPPPESLDVSAFAPAVQTIRSPFLTMDLVQSSDGQWRVVEVGDGQVSARPDSTPSPLFLRAIRPSDE